MALISHRFKFIYIKNRKVAGASVESFFGKYCITPKDEQHYTHSEVVDEVSSPFGVIGKRGAAGKYKTYWGHMPAIDIQKEIGKDLFRSYTKFCVVRNPWDKIVSEFWFVNKNRHLELLGWKKVKARFEQFVNNQVNESLDWFIYTIDGQPICD